MNLLNSMDLLNFIHPLFPTVTPRKRRTQEKLGTLKKTIKMTDQFKIDKSIALKEAHIEQKAIEKAHVDQETLEKA